MPNIEVKPAAIEALKQLSSQIKTQINETNEATLEEKMKLSINWKKR